MEHEKKITGEETPDFQNYKYVGWQETIETNPAYKSLFSPERLIQIQRKITYLLEGVADRPILVPVKTIASVLADSFQDNRPEVGSIYSRYIQVAQPARNDIRDIVDRAIQIIVSTIKNEYETIHQNNKLSIWSTVYGKFNTEGLQQYPNSMVKLNNRKNTSMMFNMNY